MEKHLCAGCGAEMTIPGKYCQKDIIVHCETCGKELTFKCNYAYNRRPHRFCSRKCAGVRKDNKCLICGKPCHEKYCSGGMAKCVTCGKQFFQTHSSKMAIHCSPECAAQDDSVKAKQKKTQFDKYGSFAFNTDKQQKTMIDKYGFSSPAKNDKVKEKARKVQLSNHNGKFAFNTDKQRNTMLAKYGSPGRLGDPEEVKRQRQLMRDKYNVDWSSKLPNVEAKIIHTQIEKYGQLFGDNSKISKHNRKFAEKIKEKLGVTPIFEYQVENCAFDMYFPDQRLAIELNPTVTHNSTIPFTCLRAGCKQPCAQHKAVPRDYHYNRAVTAKRNNIKLIQVYDWDNEEDIINMLSQRLVKKTTKLTAHKTKLVKIKQVDANKFLKLYHIQGAAKKQIYCYGLEYNNELVAVATFAKARFKAKAEYEFLRFAVKRGYTIFGAPDKMFKAFIKEVSPKSVISYIDFNHTTTDTFLPHMGFTEVLPTGPREVWTKKGTTKKVPITTLLSIGADRILGTNYGSPKQCGMNNVQIMEKEGWVKIYTAGNRVFVWKSEVED